MKSAPKVNRNTRLSTAYALYRNGMKAREAAALHNVSVVELVRMEAYLINEEIDAARAIQPPNTIDV